MRIALVSTLCGPPKLTRATWCRSCMCLVSFEIPTTTAIIDPVSSCSRHLSLYRSHACGVRHFRLQTRLDEEGRPRYALTDRQFSRLGRLLDYYSTTPIPCADRAHVLLQRPATSAEIQKFLSSLASSNVKLVGQLSTVV